MGKSPPALFTKRELNDPPLRRRGTGEAPGRIKRWKFTAEVTGHAEKIKIPPLFKGRLGGVNINHPRPLPSASSGQALAKEGKNWVQRHAGREGLARMERVCYFVLP